MAAGPSPPAQQSTDWQGRLEQDFQARHNQHLQNHGGPVNHGTFMPPQQLTAQQEMYAAEERRHAAAKADGS